MGKLWLSVLTDRYPNATPLRLLPERATAATDSRADRQSSTRLAATATAH